MFLNLKHFSTTWCSYKVIPLLKHNFNTSFRSIALPSLLCKIFEHTLKSRFEWWLKNNFILPANLFAFRKGMGNLDYLSTLTGKIDYSFNNKEFFIVTIIDIRGAFDFINIPTLISHLLSLHAPPEFCSLFLKRKPVSSSYTHIIHVLYLLDCLSQSDTLQHVYEHY